MPTPDSQIAHSESAQLSPTQRSTGDHSTYGTTHTHTQLHSSHKDATETGANHNTEEGADSDEESDNEPEDARLGIRYPAMSPRNPVRVEELDDSEYDGLSGANYGARKGTPYAKAKAKKYNARSRPPRPDSSDEHAPLLPTSHNDVGNIKHDHAHVHSHAEDDTSGPTQHSWMRAILLWIAVSVHTALEGLAIGLVLNKQAHSCSQLLIAMLMHKFLMAFSLGLKLVQSGLNRWVVLVDAALFSAMCPLGIALGLSLTLLAQTGDSPGMDLLNGSLESLAAGTFLFVTFFEMIPPEFDEQDGGGGGGGGHSHDHSGGGGQGQLPSKPPRLVRLLCLYLGFTIIVGYGFLLPE